MKRTIMIDVLMEYVIEGNLPKLMDVLETIQDVNKICYNGYSMLHHAAKHGHYEMVEMLITKGHHINWRDQATGGTPIHYATQNGHLEILKMLMINHGDLTIQDGSGKTALHYGAENGNEEIVDIILSRGHSKIIAMLLRAGEEVNVQDHFGRTALYYAAQNGHAHCVELLMSNKYNNLAGRILFRSTQIDIADENGVTALGAAAQKGHADIVKWLFSRGAHIEIEDIEGNTPMISASANGHSGVVKYLISIGALIHHKNNDGETAFLLACKHGYKEVIKSLLREKASIKDVNNNGENAFLCAVMSGNTSVVSALIDLGSNINQKNIHLDGALHIAVKRGYIEVVKILLERGVQSDENSDGENPISLAALRGYLDIMELLISEIEFDPGALYSRKSLFAATKNGYVDVVRRLLQLGVGVNIRNIEGDTPLHIAALFGQEAIVKLLIEKGANVFDVNKIGETPMHKVAVFGRSPKIVSYLMEKGADIETPDNSGRTPISIAAKKTQRNVFESVLRNDPSNKKVREALTRVAQNLTPNLARMYNNSKHLMKSNKSKLKEEDEQQAYRSNNDQNHESNNLDKEEKYDILSVIRNTVGEEYFKEYPPDIINNLHKLNKVKDYRILLVFHWIALKAMSNLSERAWFEYIARKQIPYEDLSEKEIIYACYRLIEEVFVREARLEVGEEIKLKAKFDYKNVQDIVDRFDKYIAPYIEYQLITNKNSKMFEISQVLSKRFSKLSTLNGILHSEREEKCKLYEQKANKIVAGEEFAEIRKLRFVLYRYEYLKYLLDKGGIPEGKLQVIKKETTLLENRFSIIRSGAFEIGLKKYEENMEIVGLCLAMVNFCKYVNYLLHEEDDDDSVLIRSASHKRKLM